MPSTRRFVSWAGFLSLGSILTTAALVSAQAVAVPAEEVVVDENREAGVKEPAVPKGKAPEELQAAGLKRIARAISAHVVTEPTAESTPGREIGNICVQLADGKEEVWTTGGGCAWPKVAGNGLAGWLIGTSLKKDSGWGSAGITLVRNTKTVCTIKPGGYQILDWNFADDDTSVEVVSRTLKDMKVIEKFSVKTAKATARFEVGKDSVEAAPEWVKPLLAKAEEAVSKP